MRIGTARKPTLKRKLALLVALSLVLAMVLPTAAPGAAQGQAQVASILAGYGGGYLLNLGTVSFDPLSGTPALGRGLVVNDYRAGQPGLYLVQWGGPIRDFEKRQLTRLGAEIGDYIPDFAFVVRMTPEAARRAQGLKFVRAVAIYQPGYKLAGEFLGRDGSPVATYAGQDRVSVDITAFDSAAGQSLAGRLQELGGRVLSSGGNGVVAEVPAGRLAELARFNAITSIMPVRSFRVFNDKAAGVLKVTPVWQSGLTGQGQIIGVSDTGIDSGKNDSSLNRDFQGRIKSIYTWGRPNDASDPNGHGTHVAGSLVGTGANSGGQIKGMAYGAQLVFQSILDSQGNLGGLPSDLGRLFQQAYDAGARVHSNSWGSEANGQYDQTSADVDRFIYEHPDMAILFAAGNSGYDRGSATTVYNSIGTPATAKNAITVGASENNRPDKGALGSNINAIASFSSRGWTADGRVKPDIVAPGTWILSTRSSLAPDSIFWQTYNQYYGFMGGTSMATPLTAGTTALLRQFFVDKLGVTPKASLLKAALINGADDMGYGFPSRDQGWGRVDLRNSTTPADGRQIKFDNESTALSTGDHQDYQVQVKGDQPFKVTLVWTDYPASPSASKTLVNDLDLQVTSPSGAVYSGNDFQAPYNATVDRTNNVENVFINKPEDGTYTVSVKGYNVPQGPQRYALVESGDLSGGSNPPPTPPPGDKTPPSAGITAPLNGATVSGRVNVSVNATDNVGVTGVELYVDGVLRGTDHTAPYNFTWDSTQVADGKHQLVAAAYDAAGNVGKSSAVTVRAANQVQPPPTNPGSTVSQSFTGYAGWWSAGNAYLDVGAPGIVNLKLSWPDSSDLDMVLLDPNGYQIASSDSYNNPKVLSAKVTAPGRYRVAVYSYWSGAGYRLDAAYPVDAGRTAIQGRTGNLQAWNSDLVNLRVGGPGTVNLTLDWSDPDANLSLYLYDANWNLVAYSASSGRPRSISLPVFGAGSYIAQVAAGGGGGAYRLQLVYPKG